MGVSNLFKPLDLQRDINFKDEKGNVDFKEYMKLLVVEAAVCRAVLDQRAIIPAGEPVLVALYHHTWEKGRDALQRLPNHIADSLLITY
jgi:hypothetical protein